jgi:hypothetical protein
MGESRIFLFQLGRYETFVEDSGEHADRFNLSPQIHEMPGAGTGLAVVNHGEKEKAAAFDLAQDHGRRLTKPEPHFFAADGVSQAIELSEGLASDDILTGPGVFFGLIQKCCNGMIFGTPEGESAELFLEAGAATLLDTENAQHWGKGWAFCQFYVGFGDFAKLDLVSGVEQATDIRTALDISPDPEEIFGDAAEH